MPPQRSRNSPSPSVSTSTRPELEPEDKDAEDDEEYVDDGASEDDEDGEDDEEDDMPAIPSTSKRPRLQKPARQRKRKRSASLEIANPKKPETASEIIEEFLFVTDDESTPVPAPPSPGRTALDYPPPRGTNLTLAAYFPRYNPQFPHIRVALPEPSPETTYRAPTAVMVALESSRRDISPSRKERKAQRMVHELRDHNVVGILEDGYDKFELPETKEEADRREREGN